MSSVLFSDIQQAVERTRGFIHRTPIFTNRSFDSRAGVTTFFKCENFQRGGAFKLRGATNFLHSIDPADRHKGVVAYSSGNHAQAVAIAAAELKMQATLVMPTDAPKAKLEATRSHGPRVITYDRLRESREAISKQVADETGATVVPPYDHPWIIAGQGTCAVEILDELRDLDALVVCIGGGGLLAGSALAAKTLQPSIRVFGVEPEIANDWWLSRQAGKPVEIPTPSTIADGLRTTVPGAHTFPIVQQLVDDIVLVTEQEIKDTVKFLMSRLKIVVEPSGAVGAAAVLHNKLPKEIKRAAVILSGGNLDLEVLGSL